MDPILRAMQRQIDKLQAELVELRQTLGRQPARPGVLSAPSPFMRVTTIESLPPGGEAIAFRTIWNGEIWESLPQTVANELVVHDYREAGATVSAFREMITAQVDGLNVVISTRC